MLDAKHFSEKIPALTAAFWVMKISATTLGETGGDWLSMTMNLGYAASTAIFFALLFVALVAQLRTTRYVPWIYWSVIIATSTAGTTLSDYMDRSLGLGYTLGAAILVSCLLITLALWYFSVGTLNVTRIESRKAEIFYWVTVLFSNTLGTALGDFLSDDSGLGFFGSWLLVTGFLGVVLGLNYFTKMSKVVLFWIAFVLTRPFGATFGDVLTKAPDQGGFAFGRGDASLILLAILVVTILISKRRQSA